jgi:hypothetical protein
MEGAWAIAGNKLISLSVQQVTDCDSYDQGIIVNIIVNLKQVKYNMFIRASYVLSFIIIDNLYKCQKVERSVIIKLEFLLFDSTLKIQLFNLIAVIYYSFVIATDYY